MLTELRSVMKRGCDEMRQGDYDDLQRSLFSFWCKIAALCCRYSGIGRVTYSMWKHYSDRPRSKAWNNEETMLRFMFQSNVVFCFKVGFISKRMNVLYYNNQTTKMVEESGAEKWNAKGRTWWLLLKNDFYGNIQKDVSFTWMFSDVLINIVVATNASNLK